VAGAANTLDSSAFPISVGDSIFIGIRCVAARTITSVVDSAGNTYVQDYQLTSASLKTTVYSCISATNASASNVITVNIDGNDSALEFGWIQNTGVSVYDTEGHGSVISVDSVTTNSITTSQSNTYAFAVLTDYGDTWTWTDPTGFTSRVRPANTGMSFSDRIYNSVQTGITITGSAAGNYIDRHIVVVIYKL
jgi:hypothetical protein